MKCHFLKQSLIIVIILLRRIHIKKHENKQKNRCLKGMIISNLFPNILSTDIIAFNNANIFSALINKVKIQLFDALAYFCDCI